MNPYEISQTMSDTIQWLLDGVQRLDTACGLMPHLQGSIQRLRAQLEQLQQAQSKSWQLLRHSNEHADFVMARLESMDVLCGRLVPLLNAAVSICNVKVAKIKSKRYRRSYSAGLATMMQNGNCCYAFPKDDDLLKMVALVGGELRRWLDYQTGISEMLSCNTFGIFPRLTMLSLESYQPVRKLRKKIEDALLDKNCSAVLVYGPLGVGKSSLARHVASNPPECFFDGGIEMHFGKSCSLSACDGVNEIYEQRLVVKLAALLHEMNCHKNEILMIATADDAWCLLEKMMQDSSYLIALDDVHEMDIVDNFLRIGHHFSKFFITSDDRLLCKSKAVRVIHLGMKETCMISREILKFHSGILDSSALPVAASKLLQQCMYHPLAAAMLGEALRGAWEAQEWNKAAMSFKVALDLAGTVYGCIEFSISTMKAEVRSFFEALAVLSWRQAVPVTCLRALHRAVVEEGEDSKTFLLQTRELVRRTLLKRSPDFVMYELHELVEGYLAQSTSKAVVGVLLSSSSATKASLAPFLIQYGNAEAKDGAESALRGILEMDETEEIHTKVIEGIVDVMKACEGEEEEHELCRDVFNRIVAPAIVRLLSKASSVLSYAASVKYIATCFAEREYGLYGRGLVDDGEILEKLKLLLGNKKMLVKGNVVEVVGKLAEMRDEYVMECLVKADIVNEVVMLLDDARCGWMHESVMNAMVKIGENGGDVAVEMIVESGVVEKVMGLVGHRKQCVKLRGVNSFEKLIGFGGEVVVERMVTAGIMEEIGSLLECPWDDIKVASLVLCRQLLCVCRHDGNVEAAGEASFSESAIASKEVTSGAAEGIQAALKDARRVGEGARAAPVEAGSARAAPKEAGSGREGARATLKEGGRAGDGGRMSGMVVDEMVKNVERITVALCEEYEVERGRSAGGECLWWLVEWRGKEIVDRIWRTWEGDASSHINDQQDGSRIESIRQFLTSLCSYGA